MERDGKETRVLEKACVMDANDMCPQEGHVSLEGMTCVPEDTCLFGSETPKLEGYIPKESIK